jgi:Tol biopolymer transport system component
MINAVPRNLICGLAGLLLALAAAGCGGGGKTSEPAERHLVYVKGNGVDVPVVWIAKPDGSAGRPLTPGLVGVLSPDGKTVAVARRRQGIFLVPSHGGRARRLTARSLRPQAWSPDGKEVLATAATSQAVSALVALDPETGRQTTIARGSLYGFDFSPKGDELVYSRAPESTFQGICGDQFDLYVSKLDGSDVKRITHDGLSAFPVWGPAGIAFSHFPAGGSIADCSAPGVWTIDAEGSHEHAVVARAPDEITLSGYYGFQPLDWLDDGRLLVGLRTDAGTEGVILDVKTHRLRRLGDYAEVASSDGHFSVGSGGTQQLILSLLRLSDGHRLVLRKNACCPSWNR